LSAAALFAALDFDYGSKDDPARAPVASSMAAVGER
jgi:hypothetical protein